MTRPCTMTLEAVTKAVRDGDLSRAEVCASVHDALAGPASQLNAVARLEPDHPSRAVTDQPEPQTRGRLFGAVLAHKDLYMREGWTIEAGSRVMNGWKADRTSTAIARLDQAGALDIARLNTVEFALGISGHNEHTGHVRNPWNPDHLPGGSSSGSAAAVAAHCIPAALGTDTGGSIRLPAAACGLVGLKPTFGRVSRFGVVPLSSSLDTVGPLTRTVRDAALMLEAIEGHDPRDPASAHFPREDRLASIEDPCTDLKLGVPETYFFDPDETDSEILTLVEQAIATLGEIMGNTKRVPVDSAMADANTLTTLIISCEAAYLHAPWLRERAHDYGPQVLARMAPGMRVSAHAYQATLDFRLRFARLILEETFADADILITPMWPTPIPRIDETDVGADAGFVELIMRSARNTRPFNFLGFPAISLPAGFTSNGLPLGIQLVARPFQETALLRVARAFERAHPMPDRTPQITAR